MDHTYIMNHLQNVHENNWGKKGWVTKDTSPYSESMLKNHSHDFSYSY